MWDRRRSLTSLAILAAVALLVAIATLALHTLDERPAKVAEAPTSTPRSYTDCPPFPTPVDLPEPEASAWVISSVTPAPFVDLVLRQEVERRVYVVAHADGRIVQYMLPASVEDREAMKLGTTDPLGILDRLGMLGPCDRVVSDYPALFAIPFRPTATPDLDCPLTSPTPTKDQARVAAAYAATVTVVDLFPEESGGKTGYIVLRRDGTVEKFLLPSLRTSSILLLGKNSVRDVLAWMVGLGYCDQVAGSFQVPHHVVGPGNVVVEPPIYPQRITSTPTWTPCYSGTNVPCPTNTPRPTNTLHIYPAPGVTARP